ncbi:zinc-finger homeodomain-containing protein [Cinnamomum micranthum f. kanehirae]|uniref:Zinc-finger homeodomain-containing protein n=1 Tax=Cinnamomum micranthum f. kanehirae TaxID=337451 RepID=A0A3S3NLD7_9MAGN|nr:zinc-finger homeodomain-containing protein [Cinnamomum micranthum f. kanehirae]
MELEEDHEGQEEEEEEEEEEEMGLPSSASYDALGNSARAKIIASTGQGISSVAAAAAASHRKLTTRYRECLKNHAVGIGGHAVDGCGEFMPAGEEGSLDALKCAACSCHRNFHRKVTDGGGGGGGRGGGEGFHLLHHQPYHPHVSPYYRTPYLHVPRPLALPSTSGGGAQSRGDDQDDVSNNPSPSGGTVTAAKKRFRTKFTADQKEKMLALADRVGWRIQKQDEPAVQQFCRDTGVKRHVLKVWMHNNKNTLGKKPNPSPSPSPNPDPNPNPNPNPDPNPPP